MIAVRIAAAAPVALAVVAASAFLEYAFAAFLTLATLPELELVVVVRTHRVVCLVRAPHGHCWRILVLGAIMCTRCGCQYAKRFMC